jgi:hypothetical protein
MKRPMRARLLSVALGLAAVGGLSSRVEAQAPPNYGAPEYAAPAPAYPQPAPVVAQPPPQGQWVNAVGYGWIWVPLGATTVDVGGVPSVYLYTATHGWAWYASPWGWGPFAHGAWISQPPSYGYRVWRHGPRGWAWHVGPRVSIHVGPRPGYAPHWGHRSYSYGPGPRYYGHGHRGHRGHGHRWRR